MSCMIEYWTATSVVSRRGFYKKLGLNWPFCSAPDAVQVYINMPNLFGRQPANHNIAVFASKTQMSKILGNLDSKFGFSWIEVHAREDPQTHTQTQCIYLRRRKDLTAYSLGCRYCWPGDKPFRGAKLGAQVVLDLTNTRSDKVKVQKNLWAMNMWWYPGDHWII